MDFKIPTFKTDKELFDFIVANEEDILWSRQQKIKCADSFAFHAIQTKGINTAKEDFMDKNEIDAVLVINTTNILDSHKDVHIKGIWDKSLQENSRIKHMQEHGHSFDKIIADKDDLQAYVKDYSWKQLGYDAPGTTQALVFESKIRKDRNPYMFKQYAEGNVDNHSVGMRYVKMVTCINDEDYGAEFEAYEKYSKYVVNQAELEKTKVFWAVLEAKAIEGSAVPDGSNPITPTVSMKHTPEIVEDKKVLAIKNWLSS